MKKKFLKKKINLPNLITLLRILITPIIALLILKNETQKALILLIIATSSDAIDGYLARALRKETKLGAYLDPIADKILLMLIYLSLTFKELIPEYLTQIIIIRDILIIVGTIYLISLKKKIKIFSLKISKINTAMQMIYILWTLFHISYPCIFLWKIDLFFITITTITTIVSGILYAILWVKYIKH